MVLAAVKGIACLSLISSVYQLNFSDSSPITNCWHFLSHINKPLAYIRIEKYREGIELTPSTF
jgi:hypothetical protein